MASDRDLTRAVLLKIREQIERADRLVEAVPAGRLDWSPPLPAGSARSAARLLGHLLDCLAGFGAALAAATADPTGVWAKLRPLEVNHACEVDEARRRMAEYLRAIERSFEELDDADLARRIPTVFVPDGEPLLTLLLGNLEHLINHKFQLFFYLRMMGVTVGTRDLYRFRG